MVSILCVEGTVGSWGPETGNMLYVIVGWRRALLEPARRERRREQEILCGPWHLDLAITFEFDPPVSTAEADEVWRNEFVAVARE